MCCRSIKNTARMEPRFILCLNTEAVHLECQASSERRVATLKAGGFEAVQVHKRAPLHPDVTNLLPAARAASMVRVAEAMTHHLVRAALVTNLRGAARHMENAGGMGLAWPKTPFFPTPMRLRPVSVAASRPLGNSRTPTCISEGFTSGFKT